MFKSIFSALMLLCSGSLFAINHPGPGEFGVTGEFIYFRPSVDDTYFVIQSPVTTAFPNGTRQHNNFHYRPGFRVEASYGLSCGSDLSVDFLWLKADRSKTVDGSFLWATVGRPDITSLFENFTGTATSDLNVLYERVDTFYSQSIYDNNGLNFRFLAGLEGVHLHLYEDYSYFITAAPAFVVRRDRTWAVGPQIGFDAEYDLFQNDYLLPGALSINVLTTGSILTGGAKSNIFGIVPVGVQDINVVDRTDWRVFPAVHARVGFNYETCLFGMGAGFGVGYEFSSYFRALQKAIFTDDIGDGFSHENYYNFDVQGLYVNATVNF